MECDRLPRTTDAQLEICDAFSTSGDEWRYIRRKDAQISAPVQEFYEEE